MRANTFAGKVIAVLSRRASPFCEAAATETSWTTDIELITQERLSILEERLEQLDLDLKRIEAKIDRLLAITRVK